MKTLEENLFQRKMYYQLRKLSGILIVRDVLTPEQRKENHKLSMKKYIYSVKGKQKRREWKKTEKGKIQTEKDKAKSRYGSLNKVALLVHTLQKEILCQEKLDQEKR